MKIMDPIRRKLYSYWSGLTEEYPKLVGLDIDTSSIALMEFSGTVKKLRIEHACFQYLEEHGNAKNNSTDAQALALAITRAKMLSHTKRRMSAIAAPSDMVITKQIKMSANLPESQIESLAWYETQKAFPGLTDNLYLDFSRNRLQKGHRHHELTLIATSKKGLEPHLKATQLAGLKTSVLDVDCYALERAYSLIAHQLPEQHEHKHAALINMEPTAMLLVVMHQRAMTYCNRKSSNNHKAFKTLVKKMLHDYLSERSHSDIHLSEAQWNAITQQLHQLLQGYRASTNNGAIHRLILSGRLALIPGIAELIQEYFAIPTQIAHPLDNLPCSQDVNKTILNRLAPAFMQSSGLALRGVQL